MDTTAGLLDAGVGVDGVLGLDTLGEYCSDDGGGRYAKHYQ